MSEEEYIHKGKCEGVEFIVDKGFLFRVPSLEHEWFSSYKEMKERIEKLNANRKIQQKRKLVLHAISTDGKERLITGRHAGHGKVLTTPPRGQYSSTLLYPNVDWIVAAIAERLHLIEEASKLQAILDQFEIDENFIGDERYNRFIPEKYAEEIEELVKRYEKARAAAEATSLTKERAKNLGTRKIRY